MCVVNVLNKFGEISGLSRMQFDLSIMESVPQAESSISDLHGDSNTKAKWILDMVLSLV